MSQDKTTIQPTQRDIDVWQLEAEHAIRFGGVERLGKFNWPQAVLSLIAERKKATACPYCGADTAPINFDCGAEDGSPCRLDVQVDREKTTLREQQLEAALRELTEWLLVKVQEPGSIGEGKIAIFGGPVGAQACLCISENYMWHATIAAIGCRLDNARKLLDAL